MEYIDYKNLIKYLPKKAKVVVSHAAAIPNNALKYIINNFENIEYYEFIHMIPFGNIPYCDEGFNNKKVKHNSLFVGKQTKLFVNEGKADYTPIHFSMIPQYLAELEPDICILQISREINSKISLGISVDYGLQALKSSKLKIGIQNNRMPYTFGDGEIDPGIFDYIIQDNFDLHALESETKLKNEVIDMISDNISKLIEDASTLQLGIGLIPDYVLKKLYNKKDLGVHSEMISDSIIELLEEGIITNKFKLLDNGYLTASFAVGSNKLYKYLDLNDKFRFRTVDFVNNPFNIASNPSVVSINSAIEVDLSGQVNAEKIDGVQISGVGGQVDFVRGSRMSYKGKSIIALPSTTKDFAYSRIVSKISSNNTVTTTRNDVDYVCTEYGCVKLSGKSISDRKELLISIAHPKFRSMLLKEEF